MKSIENIKKVALVFFIVTGLLHLGSSVVIANELFLKQATIINKVMDIPFILTGMIYGFASLRSSVTNPEEKHKILDVSLSIIVIIALISLIIINIFIPDLPK